MGAGQEGNNYVYDSISNRIADKLGSYSYDQSSRRLIEDHTNFYQYDNNGNVTQILEKGIGNKSRNLIYNSENQLIKIEWFEGGNAVKESSYAYDALGNRFEKSIVNHMDSSSSKRRYLYDGEEILAEYDEENTLLGVFTHSNLRTDDVLSVDVRSTKLASEEGSYFYLKDSLGSITDITNHSGMILQHYAYSSFGKVLKITNSNGDDISKNRVLKTSYGFTNREHDSESGLVYFRARYYLPEIGRFISEDPVRGRLGNPVTITNKYIYVANNPQNLVDPSGAIAGLLASSLLTDMLFSAIGIHFSAEDYAQIFVTAALILAAPFIAAASAAVAAYVGGGALIGGIVGGVTGAVIGGAIGYVAGGVGSVYGGGDFDEGAQAGLVQGATTGFFIGFATGFNAATGTSGATRRPASFGNDDTVSGVDKDAFVDRIRTDFETYSNVLRAEGDLQGLDRLYENFQGLIDECIFNGECSGFLQPF